MVREDDVVVGGRHPDGSRSRNPDHDVVQDRSVVDVADSVPDQAELIPGRSVHLDPDAVVENRIRNDPDLVRVGEALGQLDLVFGDHPKGENLLKSLLGCYNWDGMMLVWIKNNEIV